MFIVNCVTVLTGNDQNSLLMLSLASPKTQQTILLTSMSLKIK